MTSLCLFLFLYFKPHLFFANFATLSVITTFLIKWILILRYLWYKAPLRGKPITMLLIYFVYILHENRCCRYRRKKHTTVKWYINCISFRFWIISLSTMRTLLVTFIRNYSSSERVDRLWWFYSHLQVWYFFRAVCNKYYIVYEIKVNINIHV